MEQLCTPKELENIIVAPTGGLYMYPSDAVNQVYPHLYVGDVATALSVEVLKKLGITHILNAAQGNENRFYVDTDTDYYSPHGIKFLGIKALDIMNFQMKPHFEEAADFIEEGIQSGGKVLVHCREGVSRSATLALAYLIIKEGMTAQDAMRTVRSQREVIPNCGFLQQLCDLNEEVHQPNQRTNNTTTQK